MVKNVLFLCLLLFVQNSLSSNHRTLWGVHEPHKGGGRSLTIDADDHDFETPITQTTTRAKRDVRTLDPKSNITIYPKVNHLNDTHKQLMVHWLGEGSNIIICLARDRSSFPFSQDRSSVFISYDYGDTYQVKNEHFKISEEKYATIEKFYIHPTYNTHIIFTDVINKLMFTTKDHANNVKMVSLNFSPHDINFDEYNPQVLIAHDKEHPKQQLWVSEDFGQTWRMVQEYVKSYYLIKQSGTNFDLVVQRMEPTNLTIILYSSDLFKSRYSQIFATHVKDFFVKGDYIFYTKKANKSDYEMYVSYKLGKQLKCVFDTEMDKRAYFIADVSENRALIAISHSESLANLYVSENLAGRDGKVKFTLSLKSVLCYFPNSTYHDSWLHHVSDEAFADMYKVEGLWGIYLASQVVDKPKNMDIGPQHLVTRITYDHGASWHPLNVPERDNEGQRIYCSQNCSLHLSQRFSQLYPETKSASILSTKSAPGIIVATGVLGTSLKGHYGVYISTDAGFTWRQALKDFYFLNMGDHGSILTAIKNYKLRGETRDILFSTDEGENWLKTNFSSEDIRMYALMTEPGENTTIFTMFGSGTAKHEWMIIKVDFKSVFKYNCSKDDFKTWSPSQDDVLDKRLYVPCLMGQQVTYQRRIPHANCYIGQNFDLPISTQSCECDALDYECDFGFVQINEPWHCVRNKSHEDPYKVPSPCPPGTFYNRTKGYRKIPGDMCVNGFSEHYMPEMIPCPIKEVPAFLLFAQRDSIKRYDLARNVSETLPIKDLTNVIAIDFDMKNNCVYWADIVTDTIARQCFDSNKAAEVLLSTDLSSIEGMALDWISQCLYFVDGNRAMIELIRVNSDHPGRMRTTILNGTTLRKPRGIALHPKAGYMFWTDWGAEMPSVSRSNLDGTQVNVLFKKPQVEWPNGITIDRIAERIYWVDARQDYIASSDLQGRHFKKVLSKSNYVAHPFAVAVFKDTMYWDDWKEHAIFSADKDIGMPIQIEIATLTGLMDLKVFGHTMQEGTNACANATCEYICVGAPKGQHKCLCPDGMNLVNNKCVCPGNIEPFTNMTCQQIGSSCSPNFFTCGNNLCISKGWRCDGEDDCGDNSDEQNCGNQTCAPNLFVCGDGKCIPQYWKCDEEVDCADKSDELNCAKQNCTENQFSCKNGKCINKRWQCDGENDCRDNSDEENCNHPEPESCSENSFKCTSGSLTCIPANWVCDGEHDCRDNSDEANCTANHCPDYQFSCGAPSHRCIYSYWVCDGDIDCPGGLDEKNCSTAETTPAPVTQITFPKAKGKNCPLEWMFMCDNKNCIPYWWKCDNVDDCGDNSDEIGCGNTGIVSSTIAPTIIPPPLITKNCDPNTQFECSATDCIRKSWVCDGFKDCTNGKDELNCTSLHCHEGQFKCNTDNHCIQGNLVCNGHNDCRDGSDEAMCGKLPNPATPSCSYGLYPCDDGVCIPLAKRCDKKIDCRDGTDELNCQNVTPVYQVINIGTNHVSESSFLLFWWIVMPDHDKLQFLPSYSKVGENYWQNTTWTNEEEYVLTDLEPYTKYNLTIYVRLESSKKEFPPGKYFQTMTGEGVPSEPWGVEVQQRNGSHVLVSWKAPEHPNGIIQNYDICWYPPIPIIKLKLSDNVTSHLLSANFQFNSNYSFYIIAHNRLHESKPSEVVTITFDSTVDPVKELNVTEVTDRSISLAWKYDKQCDGFNVIVTGNFYLHPFKWNTNVYNKKNEITVDNLAPGTEYVIQVVAFKKSFRGEAVAVKAKTIGATLPKVLLTNLEVLENIAPAVKLSWEKPTDSRNVKWAYGIYYGVSTNEFFEKPKYVTTETSAVIESLDACEKYFFAVGVVGPLGVGPLQQLRTISTPFNKLAPPKRLDVEKDVSGEAKMLIQWSSSCSYGNNSVAYEILVEEKVKNKHQSFKTNETKDLEVSYVLDIVYGGVYSVKVRTAIENAAFTKPVVYKAPSLIAPSQITVLTENGSFIVNWAKNVRFRSVENFTYEVLVSEGNELHPESAEIYTVNSPPFIYKDADYNKIYTFGVRVKTQSSFTSELISSSSEIVNTTNVTPILVTIFFLLAILLIALGVLYFRHKKLQTTFQRFTNYHYNTRADAATFEDNGLDEDDSPQIMRFSDDEPLVIA